MFTEVGLDDTNSSVHAESQVEVQEAISSFRPQEPREKVITFDDILKDIDRQDSDVSTKSANPWFSKIGRGRPTIKTTASAPPTTFSTLPRVALIACLIAVVLPGFLGGKDNVNNGGADAGVIPVAELVDNASAIEGRQTSPTSVCTRWSHQSKFCGVYMLIDWLIVL